MDKQNEPGIAHDEFEVPSIEAFIQAIPHVFRPPVEVINKVNIEYSKFGGPLFSTVISTMLYPEEAISTCQVNIHLSTI